MTIRTALVTIVSLAVLLVCYVFALRRRPATSRAALIRWAARSGGVFGVVALLPTWVLLFVSHPRPSGPPLLGVLVATFIVTIAYSSTIGTVAVLTLPPHARPPLWASVAAGALCSCGHIAWILLHPNVVSIEYVLTAPIALGFAVGALCGLRARRERAPVTPSEP